MCRQGKKCKKTLGFPNQGERYGAKYENGVAYLLSYTVSVEMKKKRMIMKILKKE